MGAGQGDHKGRPYGGAGVGVALTRVCGKSILGGAPRSIYSGANSTLRYLDMDAEVRTQVLVVGAGNAGLSAAVAARQRGAEVVVLEKAPREHRAGATVR